MDGSRFDNLTRSLATGTRRQLLGRFGAALAGAVLGGAALAEEADAASKRMPGSVCRKDGDCASGVCGDKDATGRRRCLCTTPADCPAPRNQCLEATCSADGVCGTNALVGQPCDDKNKCTLNDTCNAAGKCVGEPVVCPTPDQCHDPGICNKRTGTCSNPAKPNGTTCSDGNACTQNDTCQNGVCTSGAPVVCQASDQCHDVGTCDPASGTCSNPAKANGTACDDGNACTTGDTCQNGACQPGTPVQCPACQTCSGGACVAVDNDPACNGTCCSGACVDLKTDEQHCGSCTTVCGPQDTCTDGKCAAPGGTCKGVGSTCIDGEECCNGQCLGVCYCTTPGIFPAVNVVPPCTSDSNCCTGKCLTIAGVGGCTLLPIGAPCEHPWHCVTGNCNKGPFTDDRFCSPFD